LLRLVLETVSWIQMDRSSIVTIAVARQVLGAQIAVAVSENASIVHEQEPPNIIDLITDIVIR
jgi:hypothetical protein